MMSLMLKVHGDHDDVCDDYAVQLLLMPIPTRCGSGDDGDDDDEEDVGDLGHFDDIGW